LRQGNKRAPFCLLPHRKDMFARLYMTHQICLEKGDAKMWLLFFLVVIFMVAIVVVAIASDRTGGMDDFPLD